ncbi:MAG: Gfo/Idh/MocA family oxidoreductase, partial [Bacteroidota bacterium]
PTYALIGAAGYVAPRHLKAIKSTGGELVAALDPNDSVGILDSYFPQAAFFTEFERFDRHLEKLRRAGKGVDYVVICSPNYLHDAHCRFALRHGAEVICEKPIVLNPWNVDALREMEIETGRRINNILQLRLHPSVLALKEKMALANEEIYDIDLTYLTARGNWYYASWKGELAKSGGIAANIGIHFFDMLLWIFGDMKSSIVHHHTHDRAAGFLQLERANVRWFLSINADCLPDQIKASGARTYRSLQIAGEEFEFSGGFEALHTRSYEHIVKGAGFSLTDVRPAVDLVHQIRNAPTVGLIKPYHPLAELPLEPHPFGQTRP